MCWHVKLSDNIIFIQYRPEATKAEGQFRDTGNNEGVIDMKDTIEKSRIICVTHINIAYQRNCVSRASLEQLTQMAVWSLGLIVK